MNDKRLTSRRRVLSQRRQWTLPALAACAALLLTLAACGGGDDDPGPSSTSFSHQNTPQPESAPTLTAPVGADLSCPETDKESLIAFLRAYGYKMPDDALDGPLPDLPLSESEIALVFDENERITELLFNVLRRPVPAELGCLSNLRLLRLDTHEESEGVQLPPEIGNLSNLVLLSATFADLGTIPPEVGNLSNLNFLTLFNSRLSGEIPAELGNLSNLEQLALAGNRLSGKIPPELGNLSNLLELDLSNNQLSGEIPPELGNLSSLTTLRLAGNQLSGCVPAALEAQLKRVELGDLSYC